ncbi:MAG TPA: NAD(P)-dependent oxidoreductase [Caulobacteraceae bacterium]|jgi:nucleoside-diphosphate-sugar epimerase|nr:NAD(P)-dependent oxidoreductase [Caulobacteraceae bacterium]
MTRPLAALTGATGFLGAQLVRALDSAGFSVRALARREPSPPGWGEVRPEVVAGDLADEAALERLVDGAAVVVHCAAAIKAQDAAGFMSVNRDGTARLAEVARRRSPEALFLLVSSLAARAPRVSSYAASKAAAESAAAATLSPDRLAVVRPPAIYGPGDRETLTLFRAAASSPVLPVLSGPARTALIHVEDAAAQVAALAVRGGGGSWALADDRPEGYGWREILQAAGVAVGRRPWLAPIPPSMLPGLNRATGVVGRLFGGCALMSDDKLGELMHPDWAVGRAEMAAGLPPPRYDLATGFASAVRWYRAAGWLGQ